MQNNTLLNIHYKKDALRCLFILPLIIFIIMYMELWIGCWLGNNKGPTPLSLLLYYKIICTTYAPLSMKILISVVSLSPKLLKYFKKWMLWDLFQWFHKNFPVTKKKSCRDVQFHEIFASIIIMNEFMHSLCFTVSKTHKIIS